MCWAMRHIFAAVGIPIPARRICRWMLGLKIERHTRISPTHAEVVFIARYRLDGRVYRLAEHSRFVLEQGRWLYCEALA